jgi:hypothetical protein
LFAWKKNVPREQLSSHAKEAAISRFFLFIFFDGQLLLSRERYRVIGVASIVAGQRGGQLNSVSRVSDRQKVG